MPDKIKSGVLYKKLTNAYGAKGSVSPGAFNINEKEFTDRIYNNPKYADKIYGAMSAAYGDTDFKFTKDDFLSGLGYGEKASKQSGEQIEQPVAPQPISMEVAPSQEQQEALAYATGGAAAMQPVKEKGEATAAYNQGIDTAFSQNDERIKTEQANVEKAQKAADEFDKTALGRLYYDYALPIHKTSIENVKNVEAFFARKLSGDKLADDILHNFDFNRIAKEGQAGAEYLTEPSRVKGKLSVANAIPKVMETLTGMAYLLAGSEITGGGSLSLLGSAYAQQNEQYRSDAKDAGLSDADADKYAMQAAGLNSVLELISPNTLITKGGGDYIAKKIASKEVFNSILKGVKPADAIKKAVGVQLKEIGEEVGQEYAQSVGDNYMKFTTDQKFKQDHVLPTMQEFKETAILTAIATGLHSSVGAAKIARNPSILERSAWLNAAADPETFSNTVDKAVEAGQLSSEKATEIKADVEKYKSVADALARQGYSDNAISRMALDAIRSEKLANEAAPLAGNAALAPVREDIEKAQSDVQNNARDAAKGIPEMGTILSSEEVGDKLKEVGAESKIKNLGAEYKMQEVDLDDLYKNNERFKKYVDEAKLRPNKDKEGLIMPVVLDAEGKVVDGMNRLAQQFVDGQTSARAFVETVNETPAEVSEESPKTEANAVQITSPSEVPVREQAPSGEGVPIENQVAEVAPQESIEEEAVIPIKEAITQNSKAASFTEEKQKKVAESKAARDASLDRLKNAWNSYRNIGITDDVSKRVDRDKEFHKSLVDYIKNEIVYRINNVRGFSKNSQAQMRKIVVKGLVKEGVSINDANILNAAFNDAYQNTKNIPGVISEEVKNVSTRQYYKDKILARIKGREAGLKTGLKEGKTTAISNIKQSVSSARKGILEELKEAKGKVSRPQLKSILLSFDRVTNNANSKDPAKVQRAIDRAVDIASQITFEINHSRDIAVIRKSLKNLNGLKRNKGMVAQDIEWITSNQFPDPSKVDDLKTYRAMLDDYIKSRKGESFNAKYTKEDIAEFVDAQNSRIFDEKMARADAELQEMKDEGDVTEDVTRDEYLAMLDNNAPPKLREFKSQKDEVLRNSLKDRLSMLKDRLNEFTGDNKKIASELSDVDLSKLNSVELRILNNIMNNIAEYGTLDRAGEIIKVDRANKIVAEMVARNPKMRVLPGKSILGGMDKMTLSNTISSLFHNNDVAAWFRSKTLGPVERAVSKEVKTMAHQAAIDLTKIFKKYDMGAIENKRLSHFAFLNQWRASDLGKLSNELTKALDKRVDDIKYQYKRATSRKKGTGTSLLEDVENNLKALESLGLIEYTIDKGKLNITIKDGLFDADNPTGTIRDMYNKLSEGEQEAYNFVINKFKSTVDGVEDYARIWEGKSFERIPGGEYFPRTPRHKIEEGDKPKNDLDLDNSFSNATKSLNKRPDKMLHERAQEFNKDVFYGTDFYTDAIVNYWNSLYTSKVMPHIQVLDRILNNDNFKKFVNGKFDESFPSRDKDNKNDKYTTQGEKNYDSFKKQLIESLNEEKRSPFISTKSNVAEEVISRMIKSVLGNIWQGAKQYGTAMTNIGVLNGPGATMEAARIDTASLVDKKLRDAKRKFLSNFTGVQRSVQGNAAFDKGYKSIDESRSWYQQPLDAHKKLQDFESIPMEQGDRAAQNQVYISSYIRSLQKQGKLKDASDFDIYEAAENPDPEAVSFAETIAAEVNNESSKAYRPAVIKDPSGAAKYLWLLQSFNLNAFMFAKQKAHIAFGVNGITAAERKEAFTHLAGYAGQIIAYNVMSYGTRSAQLSLGYLLIKLLFDIDKEGLSDVKKGDKDTKDLIKGVANTSSDLFLGSFPAPAKAAVQSSVNEAYKKVISNELNEDRKSGEKINTNGTYRSPYFAPFYQGDGGVGAPQFYISLFKQAMEAMDEKEAKTEDDRILQSLSKYAAPSAAILGLGDFIVLERSMENAMRQNKEAKRDKKDE